MARRGRSGSVAPMASRQSVVAIVNPVSSAGRTLRRLPRIERALRRCFANVVVQPTAGPGHARLLCRRALEQGADIIVSIGGDGTNNEVLSGFVDESGRNLFPHAELALASSGTGGDFQRHLGHAKLDDELAELGTHPGRPVDYGIARFIDREGHPTVRPFLNESSVGVSGLIVDYTSRSNKVLGPRLTYLVGALRGIAAHRPAWVRVLVDEQPPVELPLSLAVVANGQYFGGGMWIAPEARPDDGLFDVVYTGAIHRRRLLRLLSKVFTGRHVADPVVRSARARKVRFEIASPEDVVLIDLDGEQPGRLPATFEIVPGGISLRAFGLGARGRRVADGHPEPAVREGS